MIVKSLWAALDKRCGRMRPAGRQFDMPALIGNLHGFKFPFIQKIQKTI